MELMFSTLPVSKPVTSSAVRFTQWQNIYDISVTPEVSSLSNPVTCVSSEQT